MRKKLSRKLYSLFLVLIMISGLIPGLKTGAVKVYALPAGTIDASVFNTNIPDSNFGAYYDVKNSTDFNISWDGGIVGGHPGYLLYDDTPAIRGVFISDIGYASDTATHSIKIDANQSTVASFKLTSVTFNLANLGSDNFNVTITGFLAGGGTITYSSVNIVSPSPFPIPVSSNSVAFANNNITGFQISYNTTNGSPIGDLSLSNFSIADAQAAPSAATNAATGVSITDATLNGTVNANNSTTAVTFEYGTTASYGSTATASPSSVTGTSDTTISADITGLSPDTTYHYRVVATNSLGTTYGADKTFTTPADPPVITTSGGPSQFIEGTPIAVDNGITLTSSSSISGATVAITGSFQSLEDLLSFTNTSATTFGNIAGSYNSGAGFLTLTSSGSTATLAQWQAALRAITYNNSSNAPNTATRTVTFTATDINSNSSAAATKAISVTPVNDPPTLTTTSSNPSFTAGGSAVVLFSGTNISTVEAGQLISSISLTVSGLTDGSNELLGIDGTNVGLINDANGTTAANGFDYSVALTGNTATINITKVSGFTVSDAQNVIDGLTYSNSLNATGGPRTITLTSIQDNGGTSNGGADTTSLGISSLVNVAAAPIVPTAPDAPTGVTAVAGDGQATVSFTAPASNGGSTITQYTVTANPGGITATGSSAPITVTGLTNGTAYTFTVTATNAAGTGAASAVSNSVTPKAAQTIVFNNPGDQNFGTSPTLTATASSGLAVTFTSSNTNVATITSEGTLTFVSAGDVTINAEQAGNSVYSAASTVSQTFHVNAVAPGAPTAVTATAGNGKATINFTAPASNGGSALTSYTVTANPGGITATGAAGPITVTGLTNGIAYTFTVTATNSIGTGAASAASNSVTPAAAVTPPAPSYGGGSSAGETSTIPLIPDDTDTVQLPATISVNADGSVTVDGQLDVNSAAAAVQSAVIANSGSATIVFSGSLLGSSYTAGVGIPSAAAAQFSGRNIGLNISTPDVQVGLAPGVLGSLTGSFGNIYISNRPSAASQQTPQFIGIYAPGAQRLTSGISITGDLSQSATITLPFDIIRTSAAGEANTASDNLAVLAQYSDGTNSVERGTVTYDTNGNPIAVSIVADKLGTFTVIKLPGSSIDGNKTVIPYKVNADKAWQVGFSENIDAATVDKDSVYVTDESGNKVDVKLGVSDNVLTITPANNYTSGKTYDLYIGSKVSGKDGKAVTKALEYEFTIVQ